ncbi:MAG TPA: hypothetical protein ENN85_05410 [Methanoculleus sp.]|nr:hypothetical protein [Methanoculleus sp.]
MPGYDGTGPRGQGPMTGRGMGYCNPANAPQTGTAEPGTGYAPAYRYPVYGVGRGGLPRGGGMGRCFGGGRRGRGRFWW